MRTTVVMATWQGERYLGAQLTSIAAQTRPPDEVVIVDDASDDDTPGMLERFAEQAPFKVRILHQDERSGSTAAFQRGIEEASGDLIALADQDDIWYPHKLSRLETVMAERPDASYVFTDANLVDGGDAALAGTLWEARKFTPRLQEAVANDAFGQLAQRFLVTGCTMAFRADLRALALPVPTHIGEPRPPVVHDRWFSLVLAAAGPAIPLAEPLMAYRIHAEQQIGLASSSASVSTITRAGRKLLAPPDYTYDLRDQQVGLIEEVRDRVTTSGLGSDAALSRIGDALGYLQFRRDQPRRRSDRVVPVAREALMGTYSRQSRGLASIAVDLLRR